MKLQLQLQGRWVCADRAGTARGGSQLAQGRPITMCQACPRSVPTNPIIRGKGDSNQFLHASGEPARLPAPPRDAGDPRRQAEDRCPCELYSRWLLMPMGHLTCGVNARLTSACLFELHKPERKEVCICCSAAKLVSSVIVHGAADLAQDVTFGPRASTPSRIILPSLGALSSLSKAQACLRLWRPARDWLPGYDSVVQKLYIFFTSLWECGLVSTIK